MDGLIFALWLIAVLHPPSRPGCHPECVIITTFYVIRTDPVDIFVSNQQHRIGGGGGHVCCADVALAQPTLIDCGEY